MNNNQNKLTPVFQKYRYTYFCSVLVFSFTVIVLIGWQTNVVILRNIIPGTPESTPMTAIILMILSISLALLPQQFDGNFKWLPYLLLSISLLVSSWIIVEYIFNLPPGFETLLFSEEVSQQSKIYPGRPSPQTAVSGVITSLVIFVSFWKRKQNLLVKTLLFIGLGIVWLALYGYASMNNPLYTIPDAPKTGMSIITASGFLLLYMGTMCLFPESGIIGLMKSKTSGGFLARVLLPVAALLPILMNWLFQYASFIFAFSNSLQIALSWSFFSFILFVLIIFSANNIDRYDKQRNSLLNEVQSAEKRIKKIINSTPDAMVFVDEKGKVIMINDQVERLFGYTSNELLGQKIEKLITDRFRDHSSHRSNYVKNPEVREMGSGLELFAKQKNGNEFPVEVSLSPIDVEGLNWVCAAIRDITTRKEKEEEILKLNKELEAFSYSVSHDLRSPLRSVNGYARILEEDYAHCLDDEGRRVVQVVSKNAVKMGKLIDGLLDFSRLGRKGITIQNIHTKSVIEDIIGDLRKDESYNIDAVHICVKELPHINGDYALIRQVFVNLISNAIKYSSKSLSPEVEIGFDESKEGVIFIRDNGVGFDMKYSNKLFKVFQRLHSGKDFEGTGVGLAIVKRIIDIHDGKIWVESIPNKGTTFYMVLPLVTEKEAE